MRADRSDKPETLNMGYGLTEKDYKIASLTAVVQVQVDKMTFSTAHAFLFTHVGLGHATTRAGRILYDSECKFFHGRFICEVTFGECCENGVAAVQCFWPHSCC